jgi:hypothetical protein
MIIIFGKCYNTEMLVRSNVLRIVNINLWIDVRMNESPYKWMLFEVMDVSLNERMEMLVYE